MTGLSQDRLYETIVVSTADRVAWIRLNRPGAMNALDRQTMEEMVSVAEDFDRDCSIAVIVIAGSERAFAAGGDIKQMADRSYADLYLSDWFAGWDRLARVRKPMIASVAGYALGGGCELVMLCDIVVAADTARFGQPEIKLGVPPGIGGTQRLTRVIGKAKAMQMCLTGRMMDAAEAERTGLVAEVVPGDELEARTGELAATIANMSLPAILAVKECVNRAYESTLSEGVLFERRAFHAAFATADQAEGMAAFIEKRPPRFVHR